MTTINYDTDDPRGPRIPASPALPTSDSDATPSAIVVVPEIREVSAVIAETEIGRPEFGSAPQTPTASPPASGFPYPLPVSARIRSSPSRVEIVFDKTLATPTYPDDLASQVSVTVDGGGIGPYTGSSASVSGSTLTVNLSPSFPGSLPAFGWKVHFVAGPVSLLTSSGYPAAPFSNFESEVV